MAPLATTRSIVRRLTDPDHPRTAVALMVTASALLLAAVLVALPTPAEGSDTTPVVSVPDAPLDPEQLIGAAGEVVLPQPDDDVHRGSTIVNHRRDGISLDAALANGDGLSVELQEEDARTTRVVVSSEAIHRCGQYAGTLILTASHPDTTDDVLLLDVRFAECPTGEAPTLAGSSVNDVSRTWAEGGRAPWKPAPSSPQPPPPPPPPPAPEPAAADPAAEPADAQPVAAEPVAAEPEATPTAEPDPGATSEPDPEPTSEPDSEPTSEPEPEPEPTATTEPTSTSEPAPTADSTTSDGGGEATTPTESTASTDTTETATEG